MMRSYRRCLQHLTKTLCPLKSCVGYPRPNSHHFDFALQESLIRLGTQLCEIHLISVYQMY
jgi:hypothetical protein